MQLNLEVALVVKDPSLSGRPTRQAVGVLVKVSWYEGPLDVPPESRHREEDLKDHKLSQKLSTLSAKSKEVKGLERQIEEFRGQLGSVAYLECSIRNLGNMSMAWVRMRDSHILTVDTETFISDNRSR